MIRPTKHTHPDQTIVYVAFIILSELKKKRIIDYSALRAIVNKRSQNSQVLFVPALSFLFLLGLLKYQIKTDSFEYLGS